VVAVSLGHSADPFELLTLGHIVDELDDSRVIPLEIQRPILEKIVEFLKLYKDNPMTVIPKVSLARSDEGRSRDGSVE
jgi:hypothetical protein